MELGWGADVRSAEEAMAAILCWELLAELLLLSHSASHSSSIVSEDLALTRLERLRFRVCPFLPSSVLRWT